MILDYTKFIQALEAHTKALVEHTEALLGFDGKKAKGGKKTPAETPTETPAAVTTAAPAQTAAPAANTTVAAAPAASDPPVVTQPTLQQVADAIINLANTVSRDKAVAILQKYGASKVPELKPEVFAAVLADVKVASAPAASSGLV